MRVLCFLALLIAPFSSQASPRSCSATLFELTVQARELLSRNKTDPALAEKLRAFANSSIEANSGKIMEEALQAFDLAREVSPNSSKPLKPDVNLNKPHVIHLPPGVVFRKIEITSAVKILDTDGGSALTVYGFIIKGFPARTNDPNLRKVPPITSWSLEDANFKKAGQSKRSQQISKFLKALTVIVKQSPNRAPIERVVVTPYEAIWLEDGGYNIAVGDWVSHPEKHENDISRFLSALLKDPSQ